MASLLENIREAFVEAFVSEGLTIFHQETVTQPVMCKCKSFPSPTSSFEDTFYRFYCWVSVLINSFSARSGSSHD